MKDKTLFNEQYKYLRTNVKFAGVNIKSIVPAGGALEILGSRA